MHILSLHRHCYILLHIIVIQKELLCHLAAVCGYECVPSFGCTDMQTCSDDIILGQAQFLGRLF